MIPILQVILQLLGVALTLATKSSAPQEIIDGLQAALSQVQTVHDTAVTKTQIDGLLDYPQW
jgi:hypothetical protein